MAGCGGKKMEKGGKVEKAIEDTKKFVGDKEESLPPPKGFKKSTDKKPVPADKPGLKKLPEDVRNKMGYMKKGGKVKPGYHKMPDGKIMKDSEHKKPMKKMAKGGMVKRDGCAIRGKTKGKMCQEISMASLMEQLRQLKEANQKMKEKKKQRDIENMPRKKRQDTQISARKSRASRAPGSEGYKPTKTDMGPNMSQVNKMDKKPAPAPKKDTAPVYQDAKLNKSNAPQPNMNQVNKPDRDKTVRDAMPKKGEDKMEWAKNAMKSAQGLLQRPTSMKKGGKVGMGMTKNNYKKGGSVSSCSKRADGCAVKGKTKGRMV